MVCKEPVITDSDRRCPVDTFAVMVRDPSLRPFLLVWLLFVVLCTVAMVWLPSLDLHRVANSLHTPLLDAVMARITHLADGLVPTALALLLWWWRDLRSFLLMGLGCGISALVTQFLKRGVFAHLDRPAMFRDQLAGLPWVDGVDLHHHFSFPSGHSTAAWAMCCALAILVGRNSYSFVFALLAAVLAYSRVYLSQHFTQDILVGSLIGVLTTAAVHAWLYRSHFSSKRWLDRRWP